MKTIQIIYLLMLGVPLMAAQEKELEWWETSVFYQIYPRSFKDSDGDGIGDLNGITENLDYFKDLGIGAIWLSPIFKSPMYDFGYDVADFYAIQEEYGTMEDFDRLVERANELDIKVVLDFVPNHTSNESVWFEEALKGHEKYLDYFVWEDPIVDENGDIHPPNNWLSIFRDSAWEYKPEIGKYYLHQFVVGQPDLNFRNPDVIEEMENVIRFWLSKGVAGLRVDAIIHLFEVDKELYGGKYPDEPLSGDVDADPQSHAYLDHIYTTNQDENYGMIYHWRELLDEFTKKDGLIRIMMTEAYTTPQKNVKYFGDGEREGAQIPFNFVLVSEVDGNSTAADVKYALDQFLTYKPIDKPANWVAGNHDNKRVATKFSPELVDGVNMIVLLMPGIGVTYQGEEIGMIDGFVSWEDTVDPSGCNSNDPINYWKESRDPQRTPFQWTSGENAGFSSGNKTWLPIAEGYETINVATQKSDERSHINIYRNLIQLRADPVFRYGRYESVALNKDVLAIRRWHKGDVFIVVVNFRQVSYSIDLSYFENGSDQVQVVVSSGKSPKRVGEVYDATKLEVVGSESFVMKLLKPYEK